MSDKPASDGPAEGTKVVDNTHIVETEVHAAPSVTQRANRYAGMIEAMGEGKNPKLAGLLKTLAPIIGMIISLCQVMFPFFAMAARGCYQIYMKTPTDLLEATMGLVFCFAGGLYPTLFAAVEAARMTGWETTSAAIADLF